MYICTYVYYIYICILHVHMYVGENYFQPFPHTLCVAQLPIGFHLAPKTPVDARNAMFFPPNICSVLYFSSRFLSEKGYIYIYLHIYSNPFQRRHCFQGHLYISICYPLFWYMRVVLSFSPSAPKPFNFPIFGFQEFEKKYIHMYICTYVFYIYICMQV